MAKPKKDNGQEPGNYFRFTLTGLILFSVCLVAGTALTVAKCPGGRPAPFSFAAPDPDLPDKATATSRGPWGELLVQNIKLERPVELITLDDINPEPETWTFRGMTVAQVRALFTAHGVTAEQAAAALTPDRVSSRGGDTVFKPGNDFVLSFSPAQRQQLYAALYGLNVNVYLDYPYIFTQDSLNAICADPRLDPDDVALLKKLVYPEQDAMHLSDFNLLMNRIPTRERRVAMTQSLSQQTAALARLCIRPDTDIDKIVSYWGHIPNVRFEDIRPLLEALKGLPNGGTISLMYFLPPFARERLYTFPVPEAADPAVKDCHWTTFNFTSLKPDNNFTNAGYILQYIKNNYYQISTPSVYGDIVLFMNEKAEIKHSAIYLAADLYFTKYGNNNSQPWMIVRMSDMQAEYPTLKPYFMRLKSE